MKFFRRIRYKLIALCFLLLAAYVFWQPIISHLGNWYLQKNLSNQLGISFCCADHSIQNGQWILKNISLERPDRMTSTIEEVKITITPFWLEGRYQIDLELVKPSFAFRGDFSRYKQLLKKVSSPLPSKIDSASSITVKEGTITLSPSSCEKREQLHLEGNYCLNGEGRGKIWNSPTKGELFYNCTTSEKKKNIAIEMKEFSAATLSQVIQLLTPSLQPLKVDSGAISGKLNLLQDQKEAEWKGKLLLHNLLFSYAPCGTESSYRVKGNLKEGVLNISPEFASKWQFDLPPEATVQLFHSDSIPLLTLSHLSGRSSNLPFWTLEIEGSISHREQKGRWSALFKEKSLNQLTSIKIEGNLANLYGSFIWDSTLSHPAARFELRGPVEEYFPFFQSDSQLALKESFYNEEVVVVGEIKSKLNGWEVEGLIDCFTADESQQCTFGFSLSPQPFGKKMPLQVSNGWFEAHHLSLEKYLAPFLLHQQPMHFTGVGDFIGSFNQEGAWICYDLQQLVMETKDFLIEIPSLIPAEMELQMAGAEHWFDFTTGKQKGVIPLFSINYCEKHSGLLFTDMEGYALLGERGIEIKEMEFYCNGLFFQGGAHFNWSTTNPGHFELTLNPQSIQGTIGQLQQLLVHFNDNPYLMSIPLEGKIELIQPARIHFSFFPDDFTFQAQLEAALRDGRIAKEMGHTQLEELSMKIHYQYDPLLLESSSLFELSDLQGTLLVGKPDRIEEYSFAGDQIRFWGLNKGEFDFWIGNSSRDLLRLAGQILPDPKSESFLSISLDPKRSHFGTVHPESFVLKLTESNSIQLFNLHLDFSLNTLLKDLQRFSRTGFLFLSPTLLKGLNELEKGGGQFAIDCSYDCLSDLFQIDAKGEDVRIGSYQFQQILFSGKKRDKNWLIDRLQCDQLSLAADISRLEKEWKINFLGLRSGNSILLGLEGIFNPQESTLNADINLLEINLESIPLRFGSSSVKAKFDFDRGRMLLNDFSLPLLSSKNAPSQLLEGSLSIEKAQDGVQAHCHLKEGIYWLARKEWRLNNCSISYTPSKFDLLSQCSFEQQQFWIKILLPQLTDEALKRKGCLLLSKTPFDSLKNDPLMIQGEIGSTGDLFIQQIKGEFSGLKADLQAEESPYKGMQSFRGSMAMNCAEISPYLRTDHQKTIEEWKIGQGYLFNGQWLLDSDKWDWEFSGHLEGRDCQLKGVQLQSIQADLTTSPSSIEVQDLKMTDSAGYLEASNIVMQKKDQSNAYSFFIPIIEIKNFSPSALSFLGQSMNKKKTLTFKEVNINNFQGNLGDRSSWRADGSLLFLTPSRKNLQHTILAIPADILTRIGLNLTLLNPVKGTLYFDIQDEKCILRDLKNVYSESHLSQFYLPHNQYESYIDFDGNIHVQIRMKQYNLFFKLAELFTVTIQGTLQKPTYTLQKQQKGNKKTAPLKYQ